MRAAWGALTVTVGLVFCSVPVAPAAADDASHGGDGGSAFVSIAPCRAVDTRDGAGPLTPGAPMTVLLESCGVPSTAVAVALTFTVTEASAAGFGAVWAAGAERPSTSVVNFVRGATVANTVVSPVGLIEGQAAVDAAVSVRTQVIVDVAGYFSPTMSASAGRFVAVPPQRLVDTREGSRPAADSELAVPRPESVPADALAMVVNVTVPGSVASDALTVYATGTPRPNVSHLNTDAAGQIRAALAFVPIAGAGVTVYTRAGNDVVVDLVGYFTGSSAPVDTAGRFVPIAPLRLIDSRVSGPPVYAGGGRELDPTALGFTSAAVMANLTVTETSGPGWWRAGAARSGPSPVSSLNAHRAGSTIANAAVVPTSTAGIVVVGSATAHVIVDITGFFTGVPQATVEAGPPANDPPRRRVLIVGDSAIAAIRWFPSSARSLRGFDAIIDVESCRRLVALSCTGRERRRPPTAESAILAQPIGVADTLVVGTGYNDSSARFSGDFDRIVAAARSRGIQRIIWMTYRESNRYTLPGTTIVSSYAAMNATLRAKVASGDFGDVVIADWWAYTTRVPTWFAADGVHYRVSAAWGVGDYLSRVVAALDSRSCPAPWGIGGVTDDPCVFPESVVPARAPVDAVALYGGTYSSVSCYELGITRTVVCR